MSFDGKVILTVTESLNEKIFIIKLWQWSMSSENDKPSGKSWNFPFGGK